MVVDLAEDILASPAAMVVLVVVEVLVDRVVEHLNQLKEILEVLERVRPPGQAAAAAVVPAELEKLVKVMELLPAALVVMVDLVFNFHQHIEIPHKLLDILDQHQVDIGLLVVVADLVLVVLLLSHQAVLDLVEVDLMLELAMVV